MGRTVVGLDIGSSGLRAVQFSLGKGAPVLEKVGTILLPRGAVEAGEIKDVAAVTGALKELWANHKFSTKHVHIGVASDNVLVRQMDLDWMEPAEFAKALKYQVVDVISMPVEEANLDYHVLGEFDAPDENGTTKRMVRILLVAATIETVDGFVNAVRDAGLLPVKADLVPFALIRASRPGPAVPNSAEAVIDIGADVTNVIIHQGGQPRFVRIVTGQGGNAITDALVERFGWTAEDAERTKAELGLSTQMQASAMSGDNVFADGQPSAPAAQEHPAQAVITQVTAAFIGEIRTSLDFFLSSSGDIDTLSRVVLTGGGSLMKGLASRLASELRMPVEYGTPMQGLAKGKSLTTDDMADQRMAVAVGLALGAS